MTIKNLFILLSIGWAFVLPAQTPTSQDCLGAIPVCQQIYTESFVPPGAGNYLNEVNPNNSCLLGGEIYSIWYTFTVDQSGDFGFLLTPNNSLDDYDWVLFNITNADCSDIFDNPNLIVSCNAAGGNPGDETACSGLTGATGAGIYNNQGGGCYNNPPNTENGNSPINSLIPVQSGNTYVLMVSNWSESPFGYTIDFGVSSVNIFDFESPVISNVNFPNNCSDQTLQVTFSENIQCSSIEYFNFELTTPDNTTIPITSISSSVCDLGGAYDNVYTLLLSAPILQNGNYELIVSSDGVSDILDNCDNSFVTESFTVNIDFVSLPTVTLPNLTFCEGETVTLDAFFQGATYEWQDGSTEPVLEVTQGSTYTVTVTNSCGMATSATQLEMIPSIATEFPAEIIRCVGDSVRLVVNDSNVNILWDDGSSVIQRKIFQSGTYSVTLSNDCFTKTIETQIEFIDLSIIPLEEYIVLCEGEEYVFDVTVNGGTYLWQDGSTDPIFIANKSGIYQTSINHTCGNITRFFFIEVIPKIEVDLGGDKNICEGPVFLNAYAEGLIEYTWQDNSNHSIFIADQAGVYTVNLSSACEEVTVSIVLSKCSECEIATPNVFSPNDDGRNDFFEIIAPCTTTYFEIIIFDRWGGQVFQTTEYTDTWDGTFKGTPLPQGVYMYSIRYGIHEGAYIKNLIKNGSITILK